MMQDEPLLARDTSWLYFNHRVLQEAIDPCVPLYERLKFLAIYSSNLDEFFRVRVAALRCFRKLSKSDRKAALDIKPKRELRQIHNLVEAQQDQFGRVFQEDILPALAQEGIYLLSPSQMNDRQREFALAYFRREVKGKLSPVYLVPNQHIPRLENHQIYLLVKPTDEDEGRLTLLPLPVPPLNRFVELPTEGTEASLAVTFIDDIIRLGLPDYLGTPQATTYAIKLSRDADLYIDNEFDGDLRDKIATALAERAEGLPTRLLYDSQLPPALLADLKKQLGLSKHDLIPGARYHNFHDFFKFPRPADRTDLTYPDLPPMPHPQLEEAPSLLAAIADRDRLLHFPYQQYKYVPKLIHEAADDPSVTGIKITLYRVAEDSAVGHALLHARKQGKEVTVFVEAKARFDEASNLKWGERMEKVGCRVFYSYPNIKVHTKLLHITARHGEQEQYYTYIGTGNFNEQTATLYTDHALLTANTVIGQDTAQVFALLERNLILPTCKKLLVAPFTLRDRMTELIDREIESAQRGDPALIFLKMNSLEEPGLIAKLREADRAGVVVRLIVRGICRLVPTTEEGIEIHSIIDRFLEHGRVYLFGSGEQEVLYIGSADWMSRNLFHRVEVLVPIEDKSLRKEMRQIMDLHWADNVKARLIDDTYTNQHLEIEDSEPAVRSQIAIYQWLQQRHEVGVE